MNAVFYFVFNLEPYLVVTRVCIQEGKTFAACRRVDDLIDSRQGEVILWPMLIKTREIDAHAKDLRMFLRDQNWIGHPCCFFYFFYEASFLEAKNLCEHSLAVWLGESS